MSDELVKRLREDQPVTQDMVSTMQCALQDEAAARIEALTEKNQNLRDDIDDCKDATKVLDNQKKILQHELRGQSDRIEALTAERDALAEKMARVTELADMHRLTDLRDFLVDMNREVPHA